MADETTQFDRKELGLSNVLILSDKCLAIAIAESMDLKRFVACPISLVWRERRGPWSRMLPYSDEFIHALRARCPDEYDAIVVDYFCRDKVPVLRDAGWEIPIVSLTGYDNTLPREEIRRNTSLPFSQDAIDSLVGSPFRGSDAAVGVAPLDTFKERLNTTLTRLLDGAEYGAATPTVTDAND